MIIALAYLFIQNHHSKERLHKLGERQVYVHTELKSIQHSQKELRDQINQAILDTHVNQSFQSVDNWAQIRAYLQTSYYSLIFFHNTHDAIQWLHLARDIAASMHAADALVAAKQIQKLIQAIDDINIPSKQKILLQLDAIENKVMALKTHSPESQEDKPSKNIQTKTISWQEWFSTKYWHKKLTALLNQIGQMIENSISIREVESIDALRLSPYALADAKFSSKILVEQAQWAVLYNDQPIFSHALDQLKTNISTVFAHQAQSKAIIDAISDLQNNTKIDVVYPDYSTALQLANSRLENPRSKPTRTTQKQNDSASTKNHTTEQTSSPDTTSQTMTVT